MDPWPHFGYTQYSKLLSMFIQTFNFLAFIVPEKSTKIFKNDKIWTTIKGHNSKSYRLLTPIPVYTIHPVIVHVYMKKSLIKIFNNGKIWKPTKGHNSKSYGPLAPFRVYTIQQVIVYVYTNFQLSSFHSSWEIYENFQEWQNLINYQGT